jgi:hypothetical protein
MAETRVKVYQWQAEWQQDEAAAVADGWRVKGRERWDNGTVKVTYERGSRHRFDWPEVAMGALVILTLIVLSSGR